MARRVLFQPDEYRDLGADELALLQLAYTNAVNAVRKNVTPKGFSACSLADNQVYANYRSVWARDGAMTTIWTLDLEDDDVRRCQAMTFRTLLSHQSPAGQIPANVLLDGEQPEYGGVGGITSIDSGLWVIIALYRYADRTGDWSLVQQFAQPLQRAMDWIGAHDSNNCGLLEIPEAGDWTDLFARSYHVLYDEVLWHRCLTCYAGLCRHLGETQRASDYERWAEHVRKAILRAFWPSTVTKADDVRSFTDVTCASPTPCRCGRRPLSEGRRLPASRLVPSRMSRRQLPHSLADRMVRAE